MTDLYLWASTNACARHFDKPIAEYWKTLNHPPIADEEVIQRGGRLWEAYWPLAQEIRRKVIAHAPKLRKLDRSEPDGRPPAKPPGVIQLSFFDQAA